ncbi:hypothetical protein FSP39_012418 [Pinctada imbricata]|uniref:C1q domain-containing protein n=1 Tax=Pinctada imbricata TaxID=66713 RepID=A0AA88XM68_PINIB|nr:hypothetical protein FSP39_012418 [Pinctada imbricata]
MNKKKSKCTIAFSAVITKNFDSSIGTNHVFVYDHVESNLGGAYNSFSGTFIAPRPGTYAFLWTIFAEGRLDINGQNGEIQTELAVNGKRRGYAFTDTEVHYDDDQATGFVIVQLNQGDVVFVRSIGSTADVQGTFQHYYHGQWTFSGWKIA